MGFLKTAEDGTYFNPRSREGSDESSVDVVAADGVFQSTLPRRERPMWSWRRSVRRAISIHAPAKGATWYREKIIEMVEFQSTLPRRERHAPCRLGLLRCNFNPRSREGSDISRYYIPIRIMHFNPRSREGSD